MQFHFTLKEIVQKPWKQGKSKALSFPRRHIAQCSLYWTQIAHNRDYQRIWSFHGHIIPVSQNYLMLS